MSVVVCFFEATNQTNMMSTIQNLLKELTEESVVTRKMLERVPTDQLDWQPHVKSMSIRKLAGHIAELPGWVSMTLKTDGLNFADQPYQSPEWNSNQELLEIFEKSLAEAKAALQATKEEDLLPAWTLKNGEQVLDVKNKRRSCTAFYEPASPSPCSVRGISSFIRYTASR